jgi:hypothetical protein
MNIKSAVNEIESSQDLQSRNGEPDLDHSSPVQQYDFSDMEDGDADLIQPQGEMRIEEEYKSSLAVKSSQINQLSEFQQIKQNTRPNLAKAQQ